MRKALLAIGFLSSCLWAVPGIAKGVPDDGIRSTSTGVYADPCGNTAFAKRFHTDSIRCLAAMGPLEIPLPAHSFRQQKAIPFLVDSSWYFSKTPINKNQDRFSNEVRPFKPKSHLTSIDYILMISLALAALIITWANLKDWEKEYRDNKEGLEPCPHGFYHRVCGICYTPHPCPHGHSKPNFCSVCNPD